MKCRSARRLMRSRVEAGRFEMVPDVRHGRRGLWWKWHASACDEAIHVVDPESDPLEVKCRNRAGERVGFVNQLGERVAWRKCTKQRDEVVDTALGSLTVFCRHDREYGALNHW